MASCWWDALRCSAKGRNIKINEVLTNNTANLQDEFGKKEAWIEIANTSYSTYNVRGMYITTDRRVLNKNLTVPQRIAMMSIIPNGDERTLMSARKHLVFFLNSNPSNGTLHLNAKVDPSKETWVASMTATPSTSSIRLPCPPLPLTYHWPERKTGRQNGC